LKDQNLETKYPEFAALVKEYTTEFFFSIRTDKLVCLSGEKNYRIKEFYQTVKKNYLYPESVEATTVLVKIIDGKEARKLLERSIKQLTKGYTSPQVKQTARKRR
jgi:hypothetical protein